MSAALIQSGAAKVYTLGRRLDVLQEAASKVGGPITPIECDVTDQASVAAAVAQVERETGYIDLLINNAGVLGPDHKPANQAGSIEELQSVLLGGYEKWAPTFAVNSTAVAGVAAAFLVLLDKGNKRRGWKVDGTKNVQSIDETVTKNGVEEDDKRSSQIITVASIAGFNRFVTAGLAYGASKAAAIHLGKSLANLLAPWGIRSNVINPGVYPSDMTAGSKEAYDTKEIPAGRKGEYQDIAGAILYLSGKAGAYVNGNVLITDGGRLSVMPAMY
ncbi:NAD(P)-binding protein [Aspergillus karnatakaensis]|uniref:SDR family NAD(P)-dependent oxidoreductase n=1 Tax=Aspergillus karnatakaensis TaxID=1810916 RepID=UPI003CCCC6C8